MCLFLRMTSCRMLSEVKHPLLTKETVAAINPFANAVLAGV